MHSSLSGSVLAERCSVIASVSGQERKKERKRERERERERGGQMSNRGYRKYCILAGQAKLFKTYRCWCL